MKLLKSCFPHFQSSDPGLLQGEEEEEEDLPDPSLMSPAAKILKLGVEKTAHGKHNQLFTALPGEGA